MASRHQLVIVPTLQIFLCFLPDPNFIVSFSFTNYCIHNTISDGKHNPPKTSWPLPCVLLKEPRLQIVTNHPGSSPLSTFFTKPLGLRVHELVKRDELGYVQILGQTLVCEPSRELSVYSHLWPSIPRPIVTCILRSKEAHDHNDLIWLHSHN